ncbi:MAG: substrate-binding domain-containing protein [Phycisphaerae bacterium]|nr:substrate-binding domain-containing protein [Phycisphaerae bacterium]
MRTAILVAALATVVLLVGCDAKEPPTDGSGSQPAELLLFCGAGLRPVAEELISVFASTHNVKIVADYAGSEVLLAKMRLVRKGDLYMPGDRYYVDQAVQAKMVLSQTPVCYFVPTILVQKGNPKKIQNLRDLTRPGLKIGFGDPQACAIGRETRQLLDKNHISWQDIEKNVAFQSLTVNELGLQIQAKALDAVIVWDAIAKYYQDNGTEIAIPTQMNVVSTVDIAVLSFTSNRSLAEQFAQFAASEQGRAILLKHHYTVARPN